MKLNCCDWEFCKMSSNNYRHWKIVLLIGLMTIAGGSMNAHAVPASPGIFEITQPNGAIFKAKFIGDEYKNWTETDTGFTIDKAADGFWYYLEDSQSPVLTRVRAHHEPPLGLSQHARPVSPTSMSAPSVGQVQASLSAAPFGNFSGKILYILARFTNRAGTYNEASWGAFIANNVADYFNKASYGKVTLAPATESFGTANNGVVGWLSIPYVHPNTGSNPFVTATQRLVRDAIMAADPYVNYAAYDTDANGIVEPDELAIVVITAGYEAALSTSPAPKTWGHKWWTGNTYAPTVDGKKIYNYCMFGEIHDATWTTAHQATMGIQVHELGHLIFGLPDLYDTDGSSGGIGNWGVMGGGSWGAKTGEYGGATPVLPSAWTKVNRGWVTPMPGTGTRSFRGAGSAFANSLNTVSRSNTSASGQYFLVENRQNSGYDRGLQRDMGASFGGLAIWHIDDNMTSNSNDSHRWVDVEAADGITGPSGAGGANSTDLWRSGYKTTFSNTSTPNSRLYNGAPSNVSVTNISASGGVMTADFQVMGAPSKTSRNHKIDFNGDSKSDILRRYTPDGRSLIWFMAGPTVLGAQWTSQFYNTNWEIIGVGDFNNSGRSDILWRYKPDGRTLIWFMWGKTVVGAQWTSKFFNNNWVVAGLGDFNGDDRTDILWRYKPDGRTLVWTMWGRTVAAIAWTTRAYSNNWEIADVGDFNGSGRADVLWRHKPDGRTLIWFMAAHVVVAPIWTTRAYNNNWEIVGAAEFNNNGWVDILWRHKPDGRTLIWFMAGPNVLAPQWTTAVFGNVWEIAAVRDVNGDNRADIIWRVKSDGRTLVWVMSGSNVAAKLWTSKQYPNSWAIY